MKNNMKELEEFVKQKGLTCFHCHGTDFRVIRFNPKYGLGQCFCNDCKKEFAFGFNKKTSL